MGTWGSGSFENDDALDWVAELEETEDLSAIIRALDAILDSSDGYLEAPDCAAALAAAEIVAALEGNPSPSLPDEIIQWVYAHNHLTIGTDTVSKTQAAVKLVLLGSELQELWEEADAFEEWRDTVTELLDRLVLKSGEVE
jgi:hypothetical protein